jgi:hypothetical protein
MNEVVKFPINTPVEVTLQFEAGKRVEGRYGDQVMYSLLDNRVMYVPPYVEQRFQELATGPHGLSQKSSDLSAIPLCGKHHRTGDDSYHKLGPGKFAEAHQLDLRGIVAGLSAKPSIRVESGSFVGRLGDREYELGRTEGGVARAIRRMSEIRRETLAEVA